MILTSLISLGITTTLYAEDWVFVPSKENACNIRVFYDRSMIKGNILVEKYDVSQTTDPDFSKRNQTYLIYKSKMNCETGELTSISQYFYYKDGTVQGSEDSVPLIYKASGTPKLILHSACQMKYQ